MEDAPQVWTLRAQLAAVVLVAAACAVAVRMFGLAPGVAVALLPPVFVCAYATLVQFAGWLLLREAPRYWRCLVVAAVTPVLAGLGLAPGLSYGPPELVFFSAALALIALAVKLFLRITLLQALGVWLVSAGFAVALGLGALGMAALVFGGMRWSS